MIMYYRTLCCRDNKGKLSMTLPLVSLFAVSVLLSTRLIVGANPLRDSLKKTEHAAEDRHLYFSQARMDSTADSINTVRSKAFKVWKNGFHFHPSTQKLEFEGNSNVIQYQTSANSLLKPVFQEYVYNKRRKRELRAPRKIAAAQSQIQMPAYYPFFMAEMIPGSVKTRHPSIIAVNGCPAYYIADHKGNCRQVFQYTVNFGRQSPVSNSPKFHPHSDKFGTNAHAVNHPDFNSFRGGISRFRGFTKLPVPAKVETPTTIETLYSHPSPVPTQPQPANPRLVSLFKNAAKRFDLSFLQKHKSSSSGENIDDSDIDNLRKKILEALKITKDTKKNQDGDQHSDKDVLSEIRTTTVDYDD